MLKIAKVIKSNGTDGDILVGLIDIAIEEIDNQEPVFIEFDGLPVPFFIESLQQKGSSRAIMHITGVDSLEDAEEIVGRSVYVDYLEFEDEGEDFVGWTVFDKEREVGVVTDIEAIPDNPCLDVFVDGQEVLVPLHEDFIISVDEKLRILKLDLPEGLIP